MPEPPAPRPSSRGLPSTRSLNAVYALALAGLVFGARSRDEDVRVVLGKASWSP